MNHTKELIERAHRGDEKARETLVLENMGLIGSIVRRFAGRGYEQEDLFQIGSIGLIKAVDKFDTAFDVKFSTYAVPMITGEIKRFLRDDGMIKVSRTLKENSVKMARMIEEYSASQPWNRLHSRREFPRKKLSCLLRRRQMWNPFTGQSIRGMEAKYV